MPHLKHLKSYKSLITSYTATRAGFIALALEKNKEATPFVEEAKVLKAIAKKADNPKDLLNIKNIHNALLTAGGISDKAKKHLKDHDKKMAIMGLIENFLEPAGKYFIDELVYRFLLTKGDTLGGIIRNLAGAEGERKFTRLLISTLCLTDKNFKYLDLKSKIWTECESRSRELDIDRRVKALYWTSKRKNRTLIYNSNVPVVKKNIDLCLLECSPDSIISDKKNNSIYANPEKYIALGELKGGIDPAGADEHWKTANSALERIRNAFHKNETKPDIFFIGAAIEKAMAQEIYQQLTKNFLTNSANLTNEDQVISLCRWLIDL